MGGSLATSLQLGTETKSGTVVQQRFMKRDTGDKDRFEVVMVLV